MKDTLNNQSNKLPCSAKLFKPVINCRSRISSSLSDNPAALCGGILPHVGELEGVSSPAAWIITSAVMFNACSKQDNDLQSIDSGEVHITAADLKFQKQLVDFRDKVKHIREHPGYKSGEMMDADSAIYHIENLFNATYSFADERYGKTLIDNASVMIDVNSSDEVLLDDMVSTFNEIINVVTQIYLDCPLQDKHIVILNLTEGDITSNQLEIDLRVVMGENIGDWEPFGEDECWWYGELEGDCDGNYATELDGVVKIQEEVNASLYYIDCPEGYRWWVWSETETHTLYGDEFVENGNYLMFYIEDPLYVHEYEMTGEELNFHYNGTLEVATIRFKEDLNKPSNWLCLNVEIEGVEYPNHPNSDKHAICHESDLDYAYRYLVKVDVLQSPVPIIEQ